MIERVEHHPCRHRSILMAPLVRKITLLVGEQQGMSFSRIEIFRLDAISFDRSLFWCDPVNLHTKIPSLLVSMFCSKGRGCSSRSIDTRALRMPSRKRGSRNIKTDETFFRATRIHHRPCTYVKQRITPPAAGGCSSEYARASSTSSTG